MTRTYGTIKDVYIQGQGWVVYTSQPLNTMEMLNVEYDVYNENGELINSGTEDFSWERWVRTQGININATTAMETLQILTDIEVDEMLANHYSNKKIEITEPIPIIANKQEIKTLKIKKQRVNPYAKTSNPTTKKQKKVWEYFTNKGYKFKYISMHIFGNYNKDIIWKCWDEKGDPVGNWKYKITSYNA